MRRYLKKKFGMRLINYKEEQKYIYEICVFNPFSAKAPKKPGPSKISRDRPSASGTDMSFSPLGKLQLLSQNGG